MPDHARLWIYQSNRDLHDDEIKDLLEAGQAFTNTWTAHQKELKASFDVLNRRFLILAVDEQSQEATGCSIDKSVHFMKQVEHEFGLSLFDRTQIAFLKDGKISVLKLPEIKGKVMAGEIQKDTLTFNTLVQTKKEWSEKWMQPASETWLARYFS
jgi:hypothetical protein